MFLHWYSLHMVAYVFGLALLLADLVIVTCSQSHQQLVGQCGSRYMEPKELMWLLNLVDNRCVEGVACSYSIEAPPGTIVLLNFTHLSGLDHYDINSSAANSTYDLIEGTSHCHPRIEVTEIYEKIDKVKVTRQRTLCYDKILYGSSVFIHTQSNQVEVFMYCLPYKYSISSMNVSFHSQPADCNGMVTCPCLTESKRCDGVVDCSNGEDELNCGHSEFVSVASLGSVVTAKDTHSMDRKMLLVLVLSVALLLLVIVVVCVCLRRYRVFKRLGHSNLGHSNLGLPTHADLLPVSSWKEDNQEEEEEEAVVLPTQQLLHLSGTQSLTAESQRTETNSNPSSVMDQHVQTQETCPIARGADGEHGYKHDQHQLRAAQLYEKYRDNPDGIVPPNITWDSHFSSDFSSANNCSYYKRSPPPYPQHNTSLVGHSTHKLEPELPSYDSWLLTEKLNNTNQ